VWNFFSARWPHHSSFFWPERHYPVPRQVSQPLSRGVKCTEVGKNCNIRLKSPFISETVRDRPTVAVELIGSQTTRSIRVGSSDLEWPWKAGRETLDLRNYARTAWPRTNIIGRVTNLWGAYFYGVIPAPISGSLLVPHPLT